GHVQRGGSPTLRDRVIASEMGYYAVELLDKGVSNRIVGMQRERVYDVDISEALAMTKEFDDRLYSIANEISF
ncbi:MAG: ATP-dependent 6-phosphofructokinase, partial [Oscillospiraceae bacterium]